jgi:monooxygenase
MPGRCGHTARLVYLATGYYSYERGHVVDFPGQGLFDGPVIHPQAWPQDLSVQGRRVVVIGSGATAVTLVPALVEAGAAHVTMLQRSPSYVAAVPSRDPVATRVRQVMPDAVAHRVVRGKNVALSTLGYQVLRRYPDAGRRLLRRRMEPALPAGYPVEEHFTPTYDPWDQRLCAAADGDLFRVLGDGRASVVTASIDAFERDGIRLAGGEHLPADVIVTATGLEMEFGGGSAGVRRRGGGRCVERSRLQGADALGRAEHGHGRRLHQRELDVACGPVCAVVLLAGAAPGPARVVGRDAALPRERPGGCADARPDVGGTCSARRTCCPSRGGRWPWKVVQSYVYDLAVMRLGRIDDGHLELR